MFESTWEQIWTELSMIFSSEMSLNVLPGSYLIAFMISVSLNSQKVIISFLLKCFLIFMVEWFLKCLNKCFRDFFIRADFQKQVW